MSQPTLTVLAGPTAVGKGTVCQYIRENYPNVWFSVSATTRDPRPGEVDGTHYYFVSMEEFDQMIADGQMLEYAVVHGKNKYGTPRAKVQEALDAGRPVILETMPDARLIFLAPPSWDELVSRLVGRGTESEQEQARRLETAKIELAAEKEFDVTVVNDTVERAAKEIAELIGAA